MLPRAPWVFGGRVHDCQVLLSTEASSSAQTSSLCIPLWSWTRKLCLLSRFSAAATSTLNPWCFSASLPLPKLADRGAQDDALLTSELLPTEEHTGLWGSIPICGGENVEMFPKSWNFVN